MKQENGKSQQRFTQTNVVTFYNKITYFIDMGRVVNAFYLDFSKVFNTVIHILLLDKLTRYRLNGWSARRMEKWLTSHTQRVVINVSFSVGSLSQVGSPEEQYWAVCLRKPLA